MRHSRLIPIISFVILFCQPLVASPGDRREWNFYIDTGLGLTYSEAPEKVSIAIDGAWTNRTLYQWACFDTWNIAARIAKDIWAFSISAGASRFETLVIKNEYGQTRHVDLHGAKSDVFNAAASVGLVAFRGKALELGAYLGMKYFSYYAITAMAPETDYFETYSMMMDGLVFGLSTTFYPVKNLGIFFRFDVSGCMAMTMETYQWKFNWLVLDSGSEFDKLAWVFEPSLGVSLRD